jgi:5-(carboxyamino)imidazole ribonucleotide mutase
MPPGVPVATLAVNGARNAGILASQIIGLKNRAIAAKVERYKQNLERDVLSKAAKLDRLGIKKLLLSTTLIGR